MDVWKDLIAPVIVAILGGIIILFLTRWIERNPDISQRLRPYQTWFREHIWITALIVSILVSVPTSLWLRDADDVSKLKQNLLTWSDEAPAIGNDTGSSGDNKGPTMCEKGYYVAGINWRGATDNIKYCIGCLTGMQVICRKLNAK